MGNAVIGALRVVLGADTAALETGLNDARSKIAAFGAGLASVATAAAAAMAAVGVGVGIAVKGSLDEMDKLGKSAQSIGIPVEELSKLKYAADLSDVSLESLSKSVGKLAQNMSLVAGGSTDTAAEAFNALGVAVKNADGTLRPTQDVLAQLADKFQRMEDGAGKTALAMALFGKAGAEMIPFLNQGAAGLAELGKEAESLGLVFDQKTTAAAEAFNDSLKRLGLIKDGIIAQLAKGMLPALQNIANALTETAKSSTLAATAAGLLSSALQVLVTSGIVVGTVFSAIGKTISTVAQAIVQVAKGQFSDAWETLKAGGFDVAKSVEQAVGQIKTVWTGGGEAVAKTAEDVGNKIAAPIIGGALKAQKAMQDFFDGIAKRTASLQAQAATIGMTAYETDKARIAAEALSVAQAKQVPITDALKAKIDAVATSYAAMNEKATFGRQLFESTRTPVEQFGAEMERLNAAMERGSIDADTYARGVAQAQQQLVQADPHARNLGQALETAFGKAIDGGARLGDILKSLLSDLLRMEAQTAFKSLLYGTPGGTSGGALGGGAGLLAGIGKIFGFADGGSFKVGGTGGIDSQMVAFKASPNERVSVTKPGQDVGAGGAPIIYQTVENTFSGMTGSDRSWVASAIKTAVNQSKADIMVAVASAPRRGS